jgi:hypothetical protein
MLVRRVRRFTRAGGVSERYVREPLARRTLVGVINHRKRQDGTTLGDGVARERRATRRSHVSDRGLAGLRTSIGVIRVIQGVEVRSPLAPLSGTDLSGDRGIDT